MSKILGDSLSQELVDLFNQELTTVMLATVSNDGYPNVMPVHLLVAKDSKTIRMALVTTHKTTENIKANDKVFITVLEGPDVAVGIKGTAKVIKEPMAGNPAMSSIEIIVEEIKSDTTPTVKVMQGVRSEHRSEKTQKFFRAMFDELNND